MATTGRRTGVKIVCDLTPLAGAGPRHWRAIGAARSRERWGCSGRRRRDRRPSHV